MSPSDSPDLSIVIVTPNDYSTIARTMGYLRLQTLRARCEIVFVAPHGDAFDVDDSELRDFHGYQIVESTMPLKHTGRARAAGARAARAPIVAFAENHCFPDPQWAESLIRAHQGPWAAVGPTLGNANPASGLSWSIFFLTFAAHIEHVRAHETKGLPWHNTSYKRESLLKLGDRLEGLLEVEGLLQQELISRGHRLYLEPAARAVHLNASKFSGWFSGLLLGGRIFAATRSKGWPLVRRTVVLAGCPLIPFVRLPRFSAEIRRVQSSGVPVPFVLPMVAVGLVVHAFGEAIGYACGMGNALPRFARSEFYRQDQLSAADQRAFNSPPLDGETIAL